MQFIKNRGVSRLLSCGVKHEVLLTLVLYNWGQ